MKKKSLMLFAAALCCLVSLAQAQEASIAVYLDEAGTTCNGQTASGIINGSVWVNLDGAAAGGITGAEFRVDPTMGYGGAFFNGYTASVTPDAPITIGNPFSEGGTNGGFTSCQTASRVRLMTFQLIDMTETSDVWLNVRQHAFPPNYTFQCALLTLCDAPVFTKVCVGGTGNEIHWYSIVNPTNGAASDCAPVSVAEKTWSEIKSLYRN
jgi:hypothetical protein